MGGEVKKVELCLDLRQAKDSVLRRAKKTVVRRDQRGLGYRIRKETHYGESDCQAETGQSPSEHSEKRDSRNTPDCILEFYRQEVSKSHSSPAGCLLP